MKLFPASFVVIQPLMNLSPLLRRVLLIGLDALLLPLAVWLSFWLRLADMFHPSFIAAGRWLVPGILLIGLTLYAFTGQYKGLTRYVGSTALYRLAGRNGLLVLLLIALGLMLQLSMPPRSSWILLWLLLTAFTGAVRFALRDVLLSLRSTQHKQQLRVAIYGAGEAGAQLAAALRLAGNHRIVSFLDDNPAYWSRSINGVGIQSPHKLMEMEDSIDQVLLAIPSPPGCRRIVDQLQSRGIPVLQVPSVMTSLQVALASMLCGQSRLKICSDAMRCRPTQLRACTVMRGLRHRCWWLDWFGALPPDSGVVAGTADLVGVQ